MEKKKPILIAVAVICFLGAGVAIAFQLGLIGGNKEPEAPVVATQPEPPPTEKEKAVQKRALEIQEEVAKKAVKAGA
ncbi:MAG: hypothetical protein U0640_06000 [Phycisphaerales bacterium]